MGPNWRPADDKREGQEFGDGTAAAKKNRLRSKFLELDRRRVVSQPAVCGPAIAFHHLSCGNGSGRLAGSKTGSLRPTRYIYTYIAVKKESNRGH